MDDAGDLPAHIAAQQQMLMAASAAESDLDVAYRLQLQEAVIASIATQPPPSSSRPPAAVSDDNDNDFTSLIRSQTLELERFHHESEDHERSREEFRRATEERRRRARGERYAREILAMPDEDWERYGGEFERPVERREPYRLYFKGLSIREQVGRKQKPVTSFGIGVAVCDGEDNSLISIRKPLPAGLGLNSEALEIQALIEGLDAVISLGIKRVSVFCDHKALYNHVTKIWPVSNVKVISLLDQVSSLQGKLESCQMFLIPGSHVKFAYDLARDAGASQTTKNCKRSREEAQEKCIICLEVIDSSKMFAVDGCSHRFCCYCMRRHVEAKLLEGLLPACPDAGCKVMLNINSSKEFLSPKLLEILKERIKEDSIPPKEKVYCPYPKCSALMSIGEVIHPREESSSKRIVTETSGLRKCIKCFGSFCIKCKVPWHVGMYCYDYRIRNPQPREDEKLQSLAKQKLWRQCVKCNHMIELAEGCFHMTCRCKYQFCYTCGAEWKNKKATCQCPIWEERNILRNRR